VNDSLLDDVRDSGTPCTQNNGKITSQTETVSGEQITYSCDSLNRLASAVTSDNPNVTQWGQSYNYDGFGNLTNQNVIKGSAPTLAVTYDLTTNRRTGQVSDGMSPQARSASTSR
jgi:YD repeat-containing protein